MLELILFQSLYEAKQIFPSPNLMLDGREKKKKFFVHEKGQILNKIKMFVAGCVFKLGSYRSFCLQIAASCTFFMPHQF